MALQTYLSHLIRDEVYYDIAPFHLLYEHKQCMLLKIDYLRKTGYISCENNIYARYNTIVDLSLTVRNMIMKYKMSNNSKILLKARDMLEEINTKEQKLLTELLYYI